MLRKLIPLAALALAGCSHFKCGCLPFHDDPVVLSDDGGWCWFEDPRAIVEEGKLIVGTVANGRADEARTGDIEAIVLDLASGRTDRVELHDRLQPDDHNSPVFLVRPDGRLLTLYAKHGNENHFYYRVSEPGDPLSWGAERTYVPSESSRVTYSNLFRLPAEGGRIYDFFRGLDNSFKPSYAWSDDNGESWKTGIVFIKVPSTQRHRPYMRYASDGESTVHMIYTEGHPNDYDNSIYHIYYREGNLHASDGRVIAPLAEGIAEPAAGTLIYQGGPDNVAWTSDIRLDKKGNPYIAFSVQLDSAGLGRGAGGEDLRYYYGRWDGKAWQVHEMAHAGSRLYSGEDDYTGLVALDPRDPDVLYISTNADPVSGEPLISGVDGERHYEIFRGFTRNHGKSWKWKPVTKDSTADNLRPIVPVWEDGTILLWLRGTYRKYIDYDLEVVALVGRD